MRQVTQFLAQKGVGQPPGSVPDQTAGTTSIVGTTAPASLAQLVGVPLSLGDSLQLSAMSAPSIVSTPQTMLAGQNIFMPSVSSNPFVSYATQSVVCCLSVWGFLVPPQSVSTLLFGQHHRFVPATKREWHWVWCTFPSKLYLPPRVWYVWVCIVVSGWRYHGRREWRWHQPFPWHSCSQRIPAIGGKSSSKQAVKCPATKWPVHPVVDSCTRPDHRWQLARRASQQDHICLHLSPWCCALRCSVPGHGVSSARLCGKEGWPAGSTADQAGGGSTCGMLGLDPLEWGDYRDGRPDFRILCTEVTISR